MTSGPSLTTALPVGGDGPFAPDQCLDDGSLLTSWGLERRGAWADPGDQGRVALLQPMEVPSHVFFPNTGWNLNSVPTPRRAVS